jgi:hypothetical protein
MNESYKLSSVSTSRLIASFSTSGVAISMGGVRIALNSHQFKIVMTMYIPTVTSFTQVEVCANKAFPSVAFQWIGTAPITSQPV